MDNPWRDAVLRQLGAAIDMLENAIDACPDEVWGDRSREPEFWYLVFHTLFFLDYRLSGSPDDFSPPPPFTLDELDPAGILPERVYAKDEMRAYLRHGREKFRAVAGGMTNERAREPRMLGTAQASAAEALLSDLRHVQHHTAQLNLLLRQAGAPVPRWVARARDEPPAG